MLEQGVSRSAIATRLLNQFSEDGVGEEDGNQELYPVIIEINIEFPRGQAAARALLLQAMLGPEASGMAHGQAGFAIEPLLQGAEIAFEVPKVDRARVRLFNSMLTERFVFADLRKEEILGLAQAAARIESRTGHEVAVRLIYRIWPNEKLRTLIHVSSRTIKCDAARAAFNSAGAGIVWAVADTGVNPHPHFDLHENLELPNGLDHWDFTMSDNPDRDTAIKGALVDTAGHGTHVAGIIAGKTVTSARLGRLGRRNYPGSQGVQSIEIVGTATAKPDDPDEETGLQEIAGVAPSCKIMSLKVMTRNEGPERVETLIAAIGYILRVNGYGDSKKVHGLNISLGYDFDVDTYGAGQSPLCVEVNRLVKSGVVVVVAAGNGGGGTVSAARGKTPAAAHFSTIADPGNAEHAITVGSTHRDSPHSYGVSFFSSKGPTFDGRMKPDLVAPGEKIVSCYHASPFTDAQFCRKSGTSMAAPHVSGAVAAFLSVRAEFRGQPERVKRLFIENATDLGRRPEFQGAGLLDLMRTLQAV